MSAVKERNVMLGGCSGYGDCDGELVMMVDWLPRDHPDVTEEEREQWGPHSKHIPHMRPATEDVADQEIVRGLRDYSRRVDEYERAGQSARALPAPLPLILQRTRSSSGSTTREARPSRSRRSSRAGPARPSSDEPPLAPLSAAPRIPTAVLAPILLSRYSGEIEIAIAALAHGSGVSFRAVKAILRGKVEDVDFFDADALLTAADELQAWHNELAPYFEGAW